MVAVDDNDNEDDLFVVCVLNAGFKNALVLIVRHSKTKVYARVILLSKFLVPVLECKLVIASFSLYFGMLHRKLFR